MELNRTGHLGKTETDENWDIIENSYKEVLDELSNINNKSDEAILTAERAENIAKSLQEQPTVPVETQEIKQARINTSGTAYPTLKARIDADVTGLTQTTNTINDKTLALDKDLTDRGLNIKTMFGAKGDSVTDDTQALKNAIAYAKKKIIDTNFKESYVVVIPGGRYKITSKITLPPYVRLKTLGFVIIESYITTGATIHIKPEATDPTFLDLMRKQQYMRSPIINGSDGGLLIRNTYGNNRDQNTSIGLEIGQDIDVGVYRPVSRYAITDIAIEGFNVGMQMNHYHHYIGTFDRIMIEHNTTCVRFGRTISNVTNSGENFNFFGCLFASATIGFDWFVYGMDCNFYGCSFDFISTLFNMRRGALRVLVSGGHIEGIGDGIANTGILVFNNRGYTDSAPQLILDAPVIFCNKTPQFTGKAFVSCNDVTWARSVSDLTNMYIARDEVNITEKTHVIRGVESCLSPNLNILTNPKFELVNLSAGNAVAPFADYTITSYGMNNAVVTTAIPSSQNYKRALKITSNTNNGTWMQLVTNKYKVNPGQRVQSLGCFYIASTVMRNIAFQYVFFDILGNPIMKTDGYGHLAAAEPNNWNAIHGHTVTAPASAVEVALYCTVSKLINGETAYISELFLGIS